LTKLKNVKNVKNVYYIYVECRQFIVIVNIAPALSVEIERKIENTVNTHIDYQACKVTITMICSKGL